MRQQNRDKQGITKGQPGPVKT